MTIVVKAYANADDVLIAWQPDQWSDDWAGFQLERRNSTTQQVTVVVNRIPPQPGQAPGAANRRLIRAVADPALYLDRSRRGGDRRRVVPGHGDERGRERRLCARCSIRVGVDGADDRLRRRRGRSGGVFQPWDAHVPDRQPVRQRRCHRRIAAAVLDRPRDTGVPSQALSRGRRAARNSELPARRRSPRQRDPCRNLRNERQGTRRRSQALRQPGACAPGKWRRHQVLGRGGTHGGRARSAAPRSVASRQIVAQRAQQIRCRKRCLGQERQSRIDRQHELDDERPLHSIEQRTHYRGRGHRRPLSRPMGQARCCRRRACRPA